MQEELDIKISMLLDDELESKEALKVFGQIRNDSELRSKWLRYNAVSCVLKGKPLILPDEGFLNRISRALDQEALPGKAVVLPRKSPVHKLPVALAIAASLTVAAVIMWSGLPDFPDNFLRPSNQLSIVKHSSPEVPAPAAPVQAQSEPSDTGALPQRLTDYLITHNESTYSTGSQAVMPYARVISYSYDR
jgi:negative regulator of sigma E activity